MTVKNILRVLLVAFILISGLFMVINNFHERSQSQLASEGGILAASSTTSDSSKANQQAPNSPKVIAYYFHTTFRCSSCKKIEAYSHEAIESGFAKEVRDGTVEFRVINVEESGNEHFMGDYKLFTKSLVLVRMNHGKQQEWKNLMKVWELLGNKEAFVHYVQDELRSYLVTS